MFEHAVYSVISPEGCASILWRTADKAADAAEAMKITATDLQRWAWSTGSCDEPPGGAHRDPEAAIGALKERDDRGTRRLARARPRRIACPAPRQVPRHRLSRFGTGTCFFISRSWREFARFGDGEDDSCVAPICSCSPPAPCALTPDRGPIGTGPQPQPARRRRGAAPAPRTGPGIWRRRNRCRERPMSRASDGGSRPIPASPIRARPIRFTTLNSAVENAFAVPGGYVYITRQLMTLMDDESELAFVLGHETGHIAANHAQARGRRSQRNSIAWRARRDPRQRDRRQFVRQPTGAKRAAAHTELLARSGISGRYSLARATCRRGGI